MTELPPPPVHAPPPPPAVQRLTRPHDDRVVAGVAAGIARSLGVDPLLVRVGFVVLALSGGVGLVAYLVGWLLIPASDPDVDAVAPAVAPAAGASVLAGCALIALGLITLVDRLTTLPVLRLAAPLSLVVLGVLLISRGGRR